MAPSATMPYTRTDDLTNNLTGREKSDHRQCQIICQVNDNTQSLGGHLLGVIC